MRKMWLRQRASTCPATKHLRVYSTQRCTNVHHLAPFQAGDCLRRLAAQLALFAECKWFAVLKQTCPLLGASCVQKLDDSQIHANRTRYRTLLRSSSLQEPRDPLLKVVYI